jgi:hypothetical protein
MNRKLKAFGLAVVACGALMIAMSAPASAEVAKFNSDGSPTLISGSQLGESTWEFDGGKVSCKKAEYSGEQAEKSVTVLQLLPAYKECTGFGFPAEVDMNGCKITLRATVDLGPPVKITPQYGIDCPLTESTKKDEIEITIIVLGVRACTIQIPEQTFESAGTLTNGEAKGTKDITSKISISKLKYTQKAGEGASKCANASGTENGKYTDEVTLTGRNEGGGATSIWVE